MDHPPAFHFELLLQGELSPAATRALVAHLLHGCPRCAALLFPAESPDRRDLFPLELEPVPLSVLWLELVELTASHRHLALQRRRYRTPHLAGWLIRHSRERAPFD